MNSWQRWLRAPQTHRLRRALFQIHLWSGIGLGLYILVISITGSALLLQSTVIRAFSPASIEATELSALKGQDLKDKIAEVYSDYSVYLVVPSSSSERATYVVLNKEGGVFPRFFNQYTLEDLGASNPWQIVSFEWLVNIHDDLLMGRTGRKVNGIGGGIFLLMVFSGVLIWWQGRSRWKEGMQIKRNSPRGFNWQLHSFIGFWSLLLMFAWGLSGLYLGFPRAVGSALNWFGDSAEFQGRNAFIRFVMDIHFARFGDSQWAKWAWILVSFLPTVMVISGFILWWKRVILKQKN